MAREPLVDKQVLRVKKLYAEEFKLTRPVWDDYVVQLALAGRRGNSDPTWTAVGSKGLYLPGFSASADNEVFFSIQVPHGHAHGEKYSNLSDRGGNLVNSIQMHIHWMPSTEHAGNCLWEFTYWPGKRGTAFSDDDVVVVESLVAASGVIAEHIDALASIPGDDVGDSDCIPCRLRRLGSDDDDTFTGVALGISADAHFLISGLGSVAEYGDFH